MAMKLHRWDDVRRKAFTPEQIEKQDRKIEKELLELNLKAVRELAGKTQVEVAETSGISQAEISSAEQRKDHLVSTLRRYVEALGGELEVVARFGDKAVKLRGV
jgi:DNA-binding XRE family transcriptional regulator